MNSITTNTPLLTHALAWALLHSLWQGLLIFGALFAVLKAIPNATSRIKYFLSYSAFTGLFVWFADTWQSQFQRLKGVAVYITQPGTDLEPATGYTVKTFATNNTHATVFNNLMPQVEQYYPIILSIYLAGLAIMLFRILVNVFQLRTLRTQGIYQADVKWTNLLLYWQKQFEIDRPVKLFLSTRINVPMMLGTLKPIILLPVATINHLSTEQVEAILLHELAHIKRHDYLLNIFQTIAETILFFNPFVWLISGIIRKERENCCDDQVVANTATPLPYAHALAILESTRNNPNQLTLAATGNKNQLLNRIKRIMDMKKKNLNYSQLTIIIVAFIAVAITIAMATFTPSFAQKAKNSNSDTTGKKKMYKYKTVTIDSNGKETVTEKVSDKPIKENGDDEIAGNDDKNIKKIKKTVVINNNTTAKSGNGSSFSYSYSSDDDDLNKVIKEITIATKDAVAAIANVNLKEIEKELENAENEVNSVDWDEIRSEVRKGLAEVDKELKDENLHKKISIEVRKELEKSKKELEQAQKEIAHKHHAHTYASAGGSDEMSGGTDFESMLNAMEKDGLINRSSAYKVKKEDGQLYINGQAQPASVYEKYKKYLQSKSVSIAGNKGTLTIAVNDD